MPQCPNGRQRVNFRTLSADAQQKLTNFLGAVSRRHGTHNNAIYADSIHLTTMRGGIIQFPTNVVAVTGRRTLRYRETFNDN